jgi:hypothetical protein
MQRRVKARTKIAGPVSVNEYLLFISKPTGYELRERNGELPGVGQEIEEDGARLRVSKIGPSPLPGDRRRCAYLQPVN